jgi:hypothetical protein
MGIVRTCSAHWGINYKIEFDLIRPSIKKKSAIEGVCCVPPAPPAPAPAPSHFADWSKILEENH